MIQPRACAWLALALTISAACSSAPPFALPAVPGVPAPDASTAWSEATSHCRDAKTLSSELRLSGRIGANRRSATVHVGLTDAGQIRLEVPAPFGSPVFTLAGTDAGATLVTRDRHVLTAPARDIVDALTGLSLGPRALLAVLTGCGAAGEMAAGGVRHQDVIALTIGASRVYLRAGVDGWRVAAAELPGLLIDYGTGRSDPWPSRLRATSTADQALPIALTVTQQQVVVNDTFPDGAFSLTPPANAIPLTLAELRRSVAGDQ